MLISACSKDAKKLNQNLRFSGEYEPSAGRTRQARGLERQKKVLPTPSRVFYIALT